MAGGFILVRPVSPQCEWFKVAIARTLKWRSVFAKLDCFGSFKKARYTDQCAPESDP